jgi:hypothetical protein
VAEGASFALDGNFHLLCPVLVGPDAAARAYDSRRCSRILATYPSKEAPYLPKGRRTIRNLRGKAMLWTLFVILLVLWLVGVVSSFTLGGFIHILLVLAVVSLIFQLMTSRSPAA